MSNLNEITHRHSKDRVKDVLFILAAVVLTALSIGSVTSKAAGKPRQLRENVTVIESNLEVGR
jgi:hypothetical protein